MNSEKAENTAMESSNEMANEEVEKLVVKNHTEVDFSKIQNIQRESPSEINNGQCENSLSESCESLTCCSDPETTNSPKSYKLYSDILADVNILLSTLSVNDQFNEYINDESGNSNSSSHDSRNFLKTLYYKLKELGEYTNNLRDGNKTVQQNNISEAEHTAYQVQIHDLQTRFDDQQEKISNLQSQLEHEKATWYAEKLNMLSDLKMLQKKIDIAVEERDNAVMKYVKSEAEVINIGKKKDIVTKRLKSVESERDNLIVKNKLLNEEKNLYNQNLKLKKSELDNLLNELTILKNELNCQSIKSNWVEENMKKELNTVKEENIQMKEKLAKIAEEEYDSEDDKVNINEMKDATTKDGSDEELIFHIDESKSKPPSLKKQVKLLKKLNADLNLRIDELEKVRTQYEEQTVEIENLRSEFNLMEEKLSTCKSELTNLKQDNDDLRQTVDSLREREAELLNFTEKITAKNVTIQSEFAILEAKKLALEENCLPNEKRIEELESIIISIRTSLEKVISDRSEDLKRITEELDEKNKLINSQNLIIDEQQAEIQSLKNKYTNTIRELTKEVQQYRKYKSLEMSENGDVFLSTRTSSSSSLNENAIQKIEPDRQTLIEKIVKLQGNHAKMLEKIDFLEEHISQLVTEIKKKNKVIQHYAMREQSGVLSSDVFERHKAEIIKHGGVMSTLYDSKNDGDAIPPELAIEISQKLQTVLEDTILKNITLKDNIETLGREIERLSMRK